MVLADVSLFDLIWTMFFLFMLAAFAWVFILALSRLIRDHGLSGWAKAGWLVALIVLPLFGSILYLLVRGGWVTEDLAADGAARAQMTRTEVERRDGSVADPTGDRASGPT